MACTVVNCIGNYHLQYHYPYIALWPMVLRELREGTPRITVLELLLWNRYAITTTTTIIMCFVHARYGTVSLYLCSRSYASVFLSWISQENDNLLQQKHSKGNIFCHHLTKTTTEISGSNIAVTTIFHRPVIIFGMISYLAYFSSSMQHICTAHNIKHYPYEDIPIQCNESKEKQPTRKTSSQS